MRLLVLLLGFWFTGAAAAEVTPNWSVEVGGNVLDPSPRAVQALAITDPAHGLFLSSVGAADLVAVLALGATSSVRDQFVARTEESQDTSTVVLASNETGALVVVYMSASAGTMHRFDAAGKLLWSRDRDAQQARLLANGDVLVLDDNVLARLSAGEGSVRWVRNLLDLADGSWAGSYLLGDGRDAQIDIVAVTFRRYLVYASTQSRFWQLAIDAQTGELRWAMQAPQGGSSVGLAGCMPLVWGQDRVDVRRERIENAYTAIVERRRRNDEHLIWSRQFAITAGENGPCELTVSDDQLYLSLDQWPSLRRLMAFDADGELRWQRELDSDNYVRMAPTDGGDVILAEAVFGFPEPPRHVISRWRAADGAQLWEFAVPAVQLDLRGDGATFAIAWTPEYRTQAHYQRHAADSGEQLVNSYADLLGFQSSLFATVAWQGHPCAAEVVGTQSASVDVACLHADTGSPIWSVSTPTLDPGEYVTAMQLRNLGASRLLLRVSTRVGDVRSDHLYAVDAATGTFHWHNVRYGYLGLTAGVDGDVYVTDQDCAEPSACSGAAYRLRRLSGATGAEVWSRPFDLSPLAAGAGLVVGWRQAPGLRGFQALDATTGAERWFFAASGAGQLAPAALVTASGELIIKHEPATGALRSVEVRRLDVDDGSQIYALSPSVPAPRTELALVNESIDGDLLVTAGQTGGAWLMRARTSDGAAAWQKYPLATSPESRWVRFPGTVPTGHWSYQIRRRGEWLERRALSRIQPLTGVLSAEHLYATAVPGEGTEFGSVTLLAVSADGEAVVMDRGDKLHGLLQNRLQGWSPPGDAEGDISVQLLGTDPGVGMGASTLMTLLIANNAPLLVSDILVRADSELSRLWFRLRSCEPSSTCLHPVAGADALRMSMPAHSTVTVTFEVHDPGYRPQASSGGDVAVFRVDTPFEFGDLDLGNNVVSTPVRLGGMANGFE